MSEVLSKRLPSEELRASSEEADAKRQEDNNKKVNKPGRKPLATEPKNKRTAQNRAAQRAFRERKEQKLKLLEEKIDTLENEKKSANTESEFLRLQVQMLMNELAKHRGTHDVSDLNLPVVPSPVGNEIYKSQLMSPNEAPVSAAPSSNFSDAGSVRTTASSLTNTDEFNTKPPQQPFSFEFPWSRKNSTTSARSSQSNNGHNNSLSSNAPGLASDSSTTSSAESSPFELYNNDEQRDLPLFNKVKAQQLKTRGDNKEQQTQDFQFNDKFDEGISDFCKDLSSACGTKECPIPNKNSKSAQSSKISTPMTNSDTPRTTNNDYENNALNFNEDPLSFLNDQYDSNFNPSFNNTTFDPLMAFGNDNHEDPNQASLDELFQNDDVLNNLTTEESIYDPFGIFNQGKSPVVERRTSNLTGDGLRTQKKTQQTEAQDLGLENPTTEFTDPDVVPSRDGKLLKCTEIWDRITAHPKYSEIDIDGLCSELKSKAKCSDKGVVIDFADVNKVIDNSIQKQ